MSTPEVLVVSCSLNPASRSRRLAGAAVEALRRIGARAELVDLRDHELPLCDGDGSFSAPGVEGLRRRIASASAVLLATPVYNYALNAAAKNLVELTGRAWEGKPVGLLCAAGGRSSYMSPIGLANSLMFDFRCWIIPRFVYASRADFAGDEALPDDVLDRVEELAQEAVDIARALEWAREAPALDAVEVVPGPPASAGPGGDHAATEGRQA